MREKPVATDLSAPNNVSPNTQENCQAPTLPGGPGAAVPISARTSAAIATRTKA
jgi:hypothetical protein